jgi:hypothetical protein
MVQSSPKTPDRPLNGAPARPPGSPPRRSAPPRRTATARPGAAAPGWTIIRPAKVDQFSTGLDTESCRSPSRYSTGCPRETRSGLPLPTSSRRAPPRHWRLLQCWNCGGASTSQQLVASKSSSGRRESQLEFAADYPSTRSLARTPHLRGALSPCTPRRWVAGSCQPARPNMPVMCSGRLWTPSLSKTDLSWSWTV